MRTVTLDRKRDTVCMVDEEFELERAVAVSFTVMTPESPTRSAGRLIAMNQLDCSMANGNAAC